MPRLLSLSLWVAVLLFALPSARASAAQPITPVSVHGSDAPRHEAHREYRNVLGLKMGPMLVLEPHHGDWHHPQAIPAAITGVFYERSLIEDWLELEVSVPLGIAEVEGQTMYFLPLDLHLKKPFHPNRWLAPYVGLGPAVDVFVAPKRKVFFGGSFALGTYVWPRDRAVGLDIEVDYNIVALDGAPAHEFVFAIGPAWRL